MSLDKRAVKILHDTFWCPLGWKREPEVSPDDFDYAKARGVMFDPAPLSHDEAVRAAVEAAARVDQDRVVGAFVSSLGSRRLDLRSALGSYAVGRRLRPHTRETREMEACCACCGLHEVADADLNVLNFERVKWGGVRHGDPRYVALDLGLLPTLGEAAPRQEDLAILHAVLDTVRSIAPRARPNDLERALVGVVPSNRGERRTLIDILGYAGLLVDPKRPDFRRGFVREDDREHTSWSKDDWSYPVRWWTGACGLNEAAVEEWFGGL